ncbi:polysaccharide deacetylase family protein [Candidatus Woesearchaeota archaeon]|nr:polysaccharide deacetylase family protein [Candidatus Woesearchaeota archaeon]
MKRIFFNLSVDTEQDLHSTQYTGVTQGLPLLASVVEKYPLLPTLFVTGDCLENYPKVFQSYKRQGWEISLHGYRHLRYDELNLNQKKGHLQKGVTLFKKIFKATPSGFRAPQHSIDTDTLQLLPSFGFRYDSSFTPRNFLQVLFFPCYWKAQLKHAFTKNAPSRITDSFYEIPPSAFIFPLTGFPLSILPLFLFKRLFDLIYFLTPHNGIILFYFHSWSLIPLKSKVQKYCPPEQFLKKMDQFTAYALRKTEAITLEEYTYSLTAVANKKKPK